MIHHLCIHPDYRRMGIAAHLVSLAEDALKKRRNSESIRPGIAG